jgi:hypothetical protein
MADGAWSRRVDAAMLAVSALAPACLAAAHVGGVADVAHDRGVARVLGLDPQVWRGLDVAVGGALSALPLGTHAARAAAGEALVAGAAGGVLYVVVRRTLARTADLPRFGAFVAAIASLAATLAPAWQSESASPGGSALGAVLVLTAMAVIAAGGGMGGLAADSSVGAREPRWAAAAFALGLALGYEPLVGACALLGCATLVAADAETRASLVKAWGAHRVVLVACVLAGLAPLVVATAHVRAHGLPLGAAIHEGWSGERGASVARSPLRFVRDEVGTVLAALALVGAGIAALVARARALAAALAVVAAAGLGSSLVGAPIGPSRFAPTVLAGVAATCALAGVAMQAIVRAIAAARVPFARASAAMIVVLLLAMPVDSADESLVRTLPRTAGGAAVWDDLAWGVLAPRAVVIVTDRRLWARAASARAQGALRDDVIVVPFPMLRPGSGEAGDLPSARGASARGVLARDPALIPIWRDLELDGFPSEPSLSSLGTARTLAMVYEPRWGRSLARHLVPLALLDRFEPEPRGASDRRRALEAFTPQRDRLARLAAGDPELAEATAYLLRARALDTATSGDRDLVGRTIEDLRLFAPGDHVAAEIVARLVLAKGAPKVDDLKP